MVARGLYRVRFSSIAIVSAQNHLSVIPSLLTALDQVREEPQALFVRCRNDTGGVVPLMLQSDQYRRFAQECLEMSKTVQNARSCAVLIQMSQVWFRLAEEKRSQDQQQQQKFDQV